MRPVLHRIFTSEEFYSPLAVRTQIKSPVQWMVETARTLEVELPPRGPLLGALRQMGQVPFYPPSVKGWDGGKAWISTSTLVDAVQLRWGAAEHRAAAPAARAAGPARQRGLHDADRGGRADGRARARANHRGAAGRLQEDRAAGMAAARSRTPWCR